MRRKLRVTVDRFRRPLEAMADVSRWAEPHAIEPDDDEGALQPLMA